MIVTTNTHRLAAKLEELEAAADLLADTYLARRLLLIVSEYLEAVGFDTGTTSLEQRFSAESFAASLTQDLEFAINIPERPYSEQELLDVVEEHSSDEVKEDTDKRIKLIGDGEILVWCVECKDHRPPTDFRKRKTEPCGYAKRCYRHNRHDNAKYRPYPSEREHEPVELRESKAWKRAEKLRIKEEAEVPPTRDRDAPMAPKVADPPREPMPLPKGRLCASKRRCVQRDGFADPVPELDDHEEGPMCDACKARAGI